MNLILFTMNNNNLSVVSSEAVTRLNTESLMDLPESSYVDAIADANANAIANIQTNDLPQAHHVDAEVQTKSLSFWKLIKKSLKKIICIDDSAITPQDVRVEELTQTYDIMDNNQYGQAFSQTGATFDHAFVDGIHQYFIMYSDIILTVNPELINPFL